MIGPELPWEIPQVMIPAGKFKELSELSAKPKGVNARASPLPRNNQKGIRFQAAKAGTTEQSAPDSGHGAAQMTVVPAAPAPVKEVPEPADGPGGAPAETPPRQPAKPTLAEVIAQEARLEMELAQYKEQVGEMRALQHDAAASGVEDDGSMAVLLADLGALIQTTEGQLLETKRARLLLVLDDAPREREEAAATVADGGGAYKSNQLTAEAIQKMWDAAANEPGSECEGATGQGAGNGRGKAPGGMPDNVGAMGKGEQGGAAQIERLIASAPHRLKEGEEIVPDTRCNAPFMHAWGGGWQYHNAIVHKVDRAAGLCMVLFVTPTHESMLTCSHLGRCTRDACTFSHGCVSPPPAPPPSPRLRPWS